MMMMRLPKLLHRFATFVFHSDSFMAFFLYVRYYTGNNPIYLALSSLLAIVPLIGAEVCLK